MGAIDQNYDVVVVGSGAAGMLAAIRAHDAGLRSVVFEKARQYGGTSALSGGGMWIPCHHHGLQDLDSSEAALGFLKQATKDEVSEVRLRSYIDNAPLAAKYLESLGIPLMADPGPDYWHDLEGSRDARALMPVDMDGALLGEELHNQRQQHFFFLLFNRYALNFYQSVKLATKPRGWQWTVVKIFLRYWSDLPWRFRSRRDRRLTLGAALVGGLRKAMLDRNIDLKLDHRLVQLERDNADVVRSVVFRHHGEEIMVSARRGVILASGGFEHNQQMRDKHHGVETSIRSTLTPSGANTGDGIRAGEGLGADVEFMEHAWWFPTAMFPSLTEQNLEISHLIYEYRNTYSILINRNGERFTNEFKSYDRVGLAMIDDRKKTNANSPCWMIFDQSLRRMSRCGPIMPSSIMPDSKIPIHWWDKYIFKAETLDGLANKIGVDTSSLSDTLREYNHYCEKGVDTRFGRGLSSYDCYHGIQGVAPNPCLGAIESPPYYAIRIELGDLGTKGGLKVDEFWRVLDRDGQNIGGLYAVGNTSGSIMAASYPGPGCTLGPAITGAYVAVNDISGT